MIGTLVNTAAIIMGALIGIAMRTGIPARIKDTVMQAVSLAVALIGMKMAFQTQNEIIIVLSLVIGGVIGEIINIDKKLESLGQKMSNLVGTGQGNFVRGFVTGSLLYCVGAMSIMGALESGLLGQHKILFAKAIIDGVVAVVLASTLGVGVAFSGFSVFLYQGGITLLASTIKELMNTRVIEEMTATGGLLILALAVNMLGFKEIKAANLLPGVLIAVLLVSFGMK